jgi:prepilin-type N-terminal cleavage/methylation domain-containing protein
MKSIAPSAMKKGQRGFTLVEVLAALAIASLILVSLNLASASVRQGVDRTRESLGNQAQLSAALGLFRRDVSGIVKLRLEDGSYLFEGAATELTYPVSERRGASSGGLYLVRLRVLETEAGAQLVRDRAPLLPGQKPAASSWSDEVVLLEGPFDVSFAFRAPRSGERNWEESWSATKAMPEQIRLTITDRATGRLRIPVAVQPLLIDAEIQCAAAEDCGLAPTGATTP